MPKVSCNTGTFGLAPQVLVRYYVGAGLKVASASLALTCDFGIPIYGDASLLVNNRTKVIPHPLQPGQTVAVTVTIRRSGASVQISYPDHSSASLRGAGGRPFDGQFYRPGGGQGRLLLGQRVPSAGVGHVDQQVTRCAADAVPPGAGPGRSLAPSVTYVRYVIC